MEGKLEGIRIAVVGGDDRELVLIPELVRQGAQVSVTGFLPCNELVHTRRAVDVKEAVAGVQVVILPMPGTDDRGVIRAVYSTRELVLSEEVVRNLVPDTLILIGTAKPFLREWARRYRLRLREIAEEDEVAILNSIPTAEGAIQMAMEQLPVTIHRSQAYVLGFGRIGQTLARMLQSLGAFTTVVARSHAALARAYEQGHQVLPFQDLSHYIGQAQVVFNTVPALVLTREVLAAAASDVLIIDLASVPGGTDFKAAENMNLKAILAPGLPGKVAPRTAGEILARVIPRLIRQELGIGGTRDAARG